MQAPGPHPSRLGSSTIILPVFTILGLNVGLGPYRPANHIDRLFNTPLLADGSSAVALALPPRLLQRLFVLFVEPEPASVIKPS
jgi:hypothetical protein